MRKFILSALCLTFLASAVFLASGCRQKTTHVHSFTNYVSDNNATTEKDGTKTAHCDYEGCTATDTITDEGSKLKNETFFKTLTVDGNKVYGKVSNDTQTFSFIDEIQTAGVTKYVVSLDVYGSQQVATKVVPLNVGDNLVYVIELSDGEPQTVYEVTIRRKPLYTVSFDTNGGTAVDSQVVEEDSIIPAPVTTKIGYTFINWNFDFSQPITENTIITAKFKVKDEMSNFNFNSSVAECTITGVKDKTISEIIIPDYVTSIGDSAFANCGGITSITIGNGVTYIGNSAFKYCTELTNVTIPDGITYIGYSAFEYCFKLTYNEYENAYYLGNDTNKYVALIKAKNEIITSCNINDNCKIIGDSAINSERDFRKTQQKISNNIENSLQMIA